jgi:hypothetical protein
MIRSCLTVSNKNKGINRKSSFWDLDNGTILTLMWVLDFASRKKEERMLSCANSITIGKSSSSRSRVDLPSISAFTIYLIMRTV